MDIRSAIDIVEGRRAPVTTLYHITRLEKMDSIRQNGLVPSYSSAPTHLPRAIYLSSDMMQAGQYAPQWHKASPAEGYVLLAINVSGLDEMNLYPDDNDLADVLEKRGKRRDWTRVNWRESLELCGHCTYRGWIKTDGIRVLAYMKPGDGWKKVDMPLQIWEGPKAPEETPVAPLHESEIDEATSVPSIVPHEIAVGRAMTAYHDHVDAEGHKVAEFGFTLPGTKAREMASKINEIAQAYKINVKVQPSRAGLRSTRFKIEATGVYSSIKRFMTMFMKYEDYDILRFE